MSVSSRPSVWSRRSLLAFTGAALAAASCSRGPSAPERPLTLFAAASLKEALDAVIAAHAGAGKGQARAVYAGSSQLARQIEQGAPADLFISADLEWMDRLQERNLIDAAARRNIAGNRLVLIAPAQGDVAPLDLTPGPGLIGRVLARLGDGGRLATTQPDVPAGRYGREALTALGLWPNLEPRLAPAENVRAALALVARGEAPLGVVYATDARAEPQVAVVAEFAAALHSPIVYPAAPVVGPNAQVKAAKAFLDLLSGDQGQAILRQHGFAPPP
ncbi:molybdate ABC transporter substrate-binding protein [Brevundimonas sp.]|uniref:molybdate ABC transporter substrate-binding protein n=1 Tax=Brevundimonas sp. TaxID=1871086 RepID=UPI002FDB89B0